MWCQSKQWVTCDLERRNNSRGIPGFPRQLMWSPCFLWWGFWKWFRGKAYEWRGVESDACNKTSFSGDGWISFWWRGVTPTKHTNRELTGFSPCYEIRGNYDIKSTRMNTVKLILTLIKIMYMTSKRSVALLLIQLSHYVPKTVPINYFHYINIPF